MTTRLFSTSLICCFIYSVTAAQEIVNFVLVGDSGITENITQAHSFIAVKSYPGNIYERLDYKMGGPLQKLRTYSDSNLSILQGRYLEYDTSGRLYLDGEYNNNNKHGEWRYLNDTGKVILKKVYESGTLVFSEDPDTVKKEKTIDNPGDIEASFKKNKNEWTHYLSTAMNFEVSANLKSPARVVVSFIIDTSGKTTDIYLRRSALFIVDEEGLRLIRNSPPWNPASQQGRKVKAYRLQPLTFMGEVEQ